LLLLLQHELLLLLHEDLYLIGILDRSGPLRVAWVWMIWVGDHLNVLHSILFVVYWPIVMLEAKLLCVTPLRGQWMVNHIDVKVTVWLHLERA
jgi:hypothetical protein